MAAFATRRPDPDFAGPYRCFYYDVTHPKRPHVVHTIASVHARCEIEALLLLTPLHRGHTLTRNYTYQD